MSDCLFIVTGIMDLWYDKKEPFQCVLLMRCWLLVLTLMSQNRSRGLQTLDREMRYKGDWNLFGQGEWSDCKVRYKGYCNFMSIDWSNKPEGDLPWCVLTKAAVNVSEEWRVVELRNLVIWWIRLEEKLMTWKRDARVGRNSMVRVGVSDDLRFWGSPHENWKWQPLSSCSDCLDDEGEH